MARNETLNFSQTGDMLMSFVQEISDIDTKWPYILQYPKIIGAYASITSKTQSDSQASYSAQIHEIRKTDKNRLAIVLRDANINGRPLVEDGFIIEFDDVVDLTIEKPGLESKFTLIEINEPEKATKKGFELPITKQNEVDLWYLVAFHKATVKDKPFSKWFEEQDIQEFAKSQKMQIGKPISIGSVKESKLKQIRNSYEATFQKHWSSFDFWYLNIFKDKISRPGTPFTPKRTSSPIPTTPRASSPISSPKNPLNLELPSQEASVPLKHLTKDERSSEDRLKKLAYHTKIMSQTINSAPLKLRAQLASVVPQWLVTKLGVELHGSFEESFEQFSKNCAKDFDDKAEMIRQGQSWTKDEWSIFKQVRSKPNPFLGATKLAIQIEQGIKEIDLEFNWKAEDFLELGSLNYVYIPNYPYIPETFRQAIAPWKNKELLDLSEENELILWSYLQNLRIRANESYSLRPHKPKIIDPTLARFPPYLIATVAVVV